MVDIIFNKRNLKFLIIFISLLNFIGCYGFEIYNGEPNISFIKRYKLLDNSKVLIFKKTNLYKDNEEFKTLRKLDIKDEVIILEKGNEKYFKAGKDIEEFYKVKDNKGNIGWIMASSFLYPYTIENNELIGVSQYIEYDNELNDLMYKLKLIVINSKYNSDELLYSTSRNNKGNIVISSIDPISIELSDINNDKIDEIILKGNIYEGVWMTDAVETYNADIWFNFRDNKVIKIFEKRISGTFFAGILEFKYDYFYNKNKEGFINSIDCNYTELNTQTDETKKNSYHYSWDGKKYNLSINYVSIVSNLRFRETPTLDGKFIRFLNKDETLELLEKGKEETINKVKGTWVKVKTEKGEIGWCFDAYLEEVKD